MPHYVVTRKADQVEVYRYAADAPVEWIGYEFTTHDHAPIPDEVDPPPVFVPSEWWLNVGPFFDRFGAYKVAILASSDLYVQAIIKDASVRKYIDIVGRRSELLQAIGLIQSKGFQVSAAAILDVKPTADEVFNG